MGVEWVDSPSFLTMEFSGIRFHAYVHQSGFFISLGSISARSSTPNHWEDRVRIVRILLIANAFYRHYRGPLKSFLEREAVRGRGRRRENYTNHRKKK